VKTRDPNGMAHQLRKQTQRVLASGVKRGLLENPSFIDDCLIEISI